MYRGLPEFPGKFVNTIRPQKVTVQALDEYGQEVILTGEGEMAKCYCHELEHLTVKFFLTRRSENLIEEYLSEP